MVMKLIPLLALLTLLPLQAARADHRHYGFYNDHYYGSTYRDRRHYRQSGWSFGYSSGYGYSNRYRSRHDWHSHDHYDSFSGASFVGGLLLGSVLAAPRHDYRPARTVVIQPRHEVTVIRSEPRITTSAAYNRRLIRDLDGRCYERQLVNGTELRTELDPAECDF